MLELQHIIRRSYEDDIGLFCFCNLYPFVWITRRACNSIYKLYISVLSNRFKRYQDLTKQSCPNIFKNLIQVLDSHTFFHALFYRQELRTFIMKTVEHFIIKYKITQDQVNMFSEVRHKKMNQIYENDCTLRKLWWVRFQISLSSICRKAKIGLDSYQTKNLILSKFY